MAALWSGPDPEGQFLLDARAALDGRRDKRVLGETVSGRFNPAFELTIPPGAPFANLEQRKFSWMVGLTADDLIGLLGTLSWVIVLPEAERAELFDTARRLLRDVLGVAGEATADVDFSCTAYRCRRL